MLYIYEIFILSFRGVKMDKICSKCNVLKSSDNFNKSKLTKNGLQSWCKSCKILFPKKQNEYVYEKIEKECVTCKLIKIIEEFPSTGRKNYRRNKCRVCYNAYQIQNLKNKLCIICNKIPNIIGKKCINCYQNYVNDKNLNRKHKHNIYNNMKRRFWKYGITNEEYIIMVKLQNNLCSICEKNQIIKDW